MPRPDPATPMMEIILPDGRVERPERRAAPVFRPYAPVDGSPPGMPGVSTDRRGRRRAATEHGIGRRLDLES